MKGSKWECKIGEGCVNVYEFITDSTFIFFSCEMEVEYFGNYYFHGESLLIDEKGSVSDFEFPESSIHKAERKLYKAEIKGNKLKHSSLRYWINGKWVLSDFNFDEKYLYQKIR